MKFFILTSIAALFFLSEAGFSQCNIPCCDEEFPYAFCPGPVTACSKDPNHDPAFPSPPNFPAKAYLPYRVCVFDMGENAIWQPTTPPPTPPADPGGSGAAHDQWVKDIAAWNAGQNIPDEPTNTCGPDPCGTKPDCATSDPCGTEPTPKYEDDGVTVTAAWQFWDDCENSTTHSDWEDCLTKLTTWNNCEGGSGDNGPEHDIWVQCNSDFNAADAQWRSDNAAFTAAQSGYKQVWNQTDANSDANNAYNNWLFLCSPTLRNEANAHSSNCACLNIKADGNAIDWSDPQFVYNGRQIFPLAQTSNFPGCNETCPDRWIDVNLSPMLLYESDDPNAVADSRYTFHSVPKTTFFTGGTAPSGLASDYGAFSFYQLMEHEIGHFLGMHHPEEKVNGNYCSNNITANIPPGQLASASPCADVMTQNMNKLNGTPKDLTSDDQCQFKKLYCDPCASKVLANQQNIQQPQIYPNPSTGITNLQYEITEFTLVKISLCDILGKEIIEVFSGQQGEGYHQLSLPTQYLHSGNYICRIQTGKDQFNLKFVLTK